MLILSQNLYNMKIFMTLALLLVGTITTLCAQDFIVLKTGEEIKSKVIELTPTEIKYKAFDNLDSPIITIDRKTVFMCRYANGKTEVITPITTENASNPIVQKTEHSKEVKKEEKPAPSVLQPSKESKRGITGSVFIGGSLPIGNYANKDLETNEKAAGGNVGFNGGLQIGYRFNDKHSLLCETQWALNSYKIQLEDLRYVYSLHGDWTHISVMPSFRIEVPISNNLDFYSIASAGVWFTSMKGSLGNTFKTLDINTKSTSFGYGATVGLTFNKSVNLAIKYMAANPTFENYKPSVSILQAAIGYQF